MLAKLMMGGGDFVRSLRRRRLVAFALLGVGIVGVVCYLLFVHGKDTLPDFAQGFYLGASSGICLGAVILLVRVTVLLHSPEAQKRAKIEEQDEREKAIVQTAFRWAGSLPRPPRCWWWCPSAAPPFTPCWAPWRSTALRFRCPL